MNTKLCGVAGCTATADYKINSDEYGARVVCEGHTLSGDVLEVYNDE